MILELMDTITQTTVPKWNGNIVEEDEKKGWEDVKKAHTKGEFREMIVRKSCSYTSRPMCIKATIWLVWVRSSERRKIWAGP
jgi:hypothetical protein